MQFFTNNIPIFININLVNTMDCKILLTIKFLQNVALYSTIKSAILCKNEKEGAL